MLEEVKRVTPLWNPNLDDGVVLTMAPLWRLVPQHKSWQKELRSRWDELCAGKYDWAHVAMYLWPERVVPECAKERSLAIAHGLDHRAKLWAPARRVRGHEHALSRIRRQPGVDLWHRDVPRLVERELPLVDDLAVGPAQLHHASVGKRRATAPSASASVVVSEVLSTGRITCSSCSSTRSTRKFSSER